VSSPEVTVVIPTRNRWDLLSTASLPSALGQEGVDLEVVVVDEGSTDPTPEGLAALDEPRLRVVRHDRAKGVAQARNAGIRAARGEWVALLDDDDLWAPWKLRAQLQVGREQQAVFVYGAAAALAPDRSWVYSLAATDPATLLRTLLSRNVLWGGCSNVVARTDVLQKLGGFDEALFQLCDWDLWIRLALAGPAAACDEVLVACIEHEGSMLLTSEDDVFKEFAYLEAKHAAAAAAYGLRFDQRVFTRWVANGHRRAGRRVRAASVYLRGAFANRDPGNLVRAPAALSGVALHGWRRRLLRRPDPYGRIVDPAAEPPWVALYRRRPRSSAHAISRASSPTEA
jgi:glycosyltransferase involved in cell wall biosynthesis